ncbi:hypothetical protein EV193_101788 [Herbihabitans rhizosphaerae]|uniref:Secreted protein n=1 Tax=Herbihabitans rhizosphaerae TaxID=1872711 RepID=A0A4Q7L6E2_9PSEU|nr:hypothetical protein [Herbihabitans rhizosphaerae]RZS44907.1 hypothetical protein EV193_101788 [Herbihabitans rhizosphaerae]
MRKSLRLLRNAVLVSAAIAVAAAPVAVAEQPSTTTPPTTTSKPAEDPAKELAERVAKYTERSNKLESDANAALKAAQNASNPAQAKSAKEAAEKVKKDAAAFHAELQKALDNWPDNVPPQQNHELRIKALQALSRSDRAATTAGQAIEIADSKLGGEVPDKSEIIVDPVKVARGDVIAVAVFCAQGQGGMFSSDVIDFVEESRFHEDQVWAIGGFVKDNATPGKHTVTANCGKEQLTATFEVTGAPVVDRPAPTPDDVRRKVVIRPSGKIETGGGATAHEVR